MSFREDNTAYEAWLQTQCDVVPEDIADKHKQMKQSAFVFLRATYFRWAKQIGKLCPQLMDAPQILSVGDLHLENFGTWRDADGRFVWGVNDFDEAAVMPYVLDLVRLAASIRLAPDRAVDNRAAAAALLKGYREGLEVPQPALLDEGETWLRPYAIGSDIESGEFWDKLQEGEAIPAHRRQPRCQAASGCHAAAERKPAEGRDEHLLPQTRRGRRQPRTAALRRHCRLARRPGGARGEGAGAVGVAVGSWCDRRFGLA